MFGITTQQTQEIDFWRRLSPELSIEKESTPQPADFGDLDRFNTLLKHEGYFQIPALIGEDILAPLRACIVRLQERRIPLAFAYVYDEFWLVYRRLSPLFATVLGKDYRALPDFWAWHIVPSEKASGWGAHRDRTQQCLEPDDSPMSLSVWIPLTDATPLNGCMYVLPAHRDERIRTRKYDGDDNIVVHNLQDIRALPAVAGSLLGWNQALLHWGARASSMASGPRISISAEFQRGDRPAFNKPLLDPHSLPSFKRRLGLIGKVTLHYEHMYKLTPDLSTLAHLLRDRYLPEMAPPVRPDPLAGIEWESGGGG